MGPGLPGPPDAGRSSEVIMIPSATWTCLVVVLAGPGTNPSWLGAVGSVTSSIVQPLCQKWPR